jgi:hypothetical protein
VCSGTVTAGYYILIRPFQNKFILKRCARLYADPAPPARLRHRTARTGQYYQVRCNLYTAFVFTLSPWCAALAAGRHYRCLCLMRLWFTCFGPISLLQTSGNVLTAHFSKAVKNWWCQQCLDTLMIFSPYYLYTYSFAGYRWYLFCTS